MAVDDLFRWWDEGIVTVGEFTTHAYRILDEDNAVEMFDEIEARAPYKEGTRFPFKTIMKDMLECCAQEEIYFISSAGATPREKVPQKKRWAVIRWMLAKRRRA